jgi:hypothetical protein
MRGYGGRPDEAAKWRKESRTFQSGTMEKQ